MYDDIMSPPINDKDIKHLYLAEQMLLLWLDAQMKLTSKGLSITYFPIICFYICFVMYVIGGGGHLTSDSTPVQQKGRCCTVIYLNTNIPRIEQVGNGDMSASLTGGLSYCTNS